MKKKIAIPVMISLAVVMIGVFLGMMLMPRETITLVEAGESKYSIVYPKGADSAEKSCVKALEKSFKDILNVDITSKSDALNFGETHEGEACKILIGETNYPASEGIYEGLGYYEYKVDIVDKNLVIAAYTKEGYAAAAEWLETTAFSSMKDGVLEVSVDEQIGKTKEKDELVAWQIDGKDISKYSIVYASDLDRRQLTSLVENVAEATGVVLPVYSDKEKPVGKYEILFGNTNRQESEKVDFPGYLCYNVAVVNSKLVVKIGGEHSFKLTLKGYFDDLLKNDDIVMGSNYSVKGNYYDEPYDVSLAEGTDIRILDCNLMAEWASYGGSDEWPVSQRVEMLNATLDFYKPTIVGIQEASPLWYEHIKKYNKIDQWTLLEFENPRRVDGESACTTLMFRTDLYELLDSGLGSYSVVQNERGQCYVWALLKDIATGTEFCFISTHWAIEDYGAPAYVQSEELGNFVREMMIKGYPVFTTGDFNNGEASAPYVNYMKYANIVDAKSIAVELVNDIGSWHDYAKDVPSYYSCDHITTTPGCKVLKFETLIHNQQIHASDHSWLIADIAFGEVGKKAMTIAGNDISSYSIIYGGTGARNAAATLAKAIFENTGYHLPIYEDVNKEEAALEILVGETNRKESSALREAGYLEYEMKVVDSKLVASIKGNYLANKMVESFFDSVDRDATGIAVSDNYYLYGGYIDDPYDTSFSNGANLRVMSANVMAEYASYGGGEDRPVSRRKEILFSALEYYKPTVVGLQQMSPGWCNEIKDYDEFDKWTLIETENPNRTDGTYIWTTFMYRNDMYDLLDGGYKFYDTFDNENWQCYVWGILSDKHNGKKFVVVSTAISGGDISEEQFDELAAFVNSMESQGYPVIVTGDYGANGSENKELYQALLSDSGLKDCKGTARNRLNNISSVHNYGEKTEWANSRNHILISPNMASLKFETMENNRMEYLSGHSPVWVDIAFEGKEVGYSFK